MRCRRSATRTASDSTSVCDGAGVARRRPTARSSRALSSAPDAAVNDFTVRASRPAYLDDVLDGREFRFAGCQRGDLGLWMPAR